MSDTLNFGMPRKADFQHYTVCGPFLPNLDDLVDRRSYHGLWPDSFFIYGTLRDRAGNMYTIARRIPYGMPTEFTEKGVERKAMGSRLMFQTNRGDSDLRLKVDLMKASGSSDEAVVERRGETVRLSPGPNPRGKAWQAEVGVHDIAWKEEGVLSFTGKAILPALQWYLIARDEGTLYGSMMYEASGTVMGEPVEGFVFFEQSHMAEGGVLYAHRDTLVGKALENCWYSWGTRWDDGSVEVGHFICGNDRAGFGMATDGKKLTLCTSDATAVVTRAADGYWHNGIRINAGGEQWEIVPDPRGRQIDMAKLKNPQQEGLVRRVGETRKPVAWFAWGETAPSHGNTRRNRYSI